MSSFLSNTKDLNAPQTPMDGLRNYIQIIINKLDLGQARSAQLVAVDLMLILTEGNEEIAAQLPQEMADRARHTQAFLAYIAHLETAAHKAGYDAGQRITRITLGLEPIDGDYTGHGIDREQED